MATGVATGVANGVANRAADRVANADHGGSIARRPPPSPKNNAEWAEGMRGARNFGSPALRHYPALFLGEGGPGRPLLSSAGGGLTPS